MKPEGHSAECIQVSVFMSTKLIIETSDVGLNEGVQSSASRSDDPTY